MSKKLWLVIGFVFSSNVFAADYPEYNITVNKHKLHYYQTGSGKPVFLLTGYATTSNFWNKSFVNCLARNHTVYLVDYWGINTDDKVAGNTSIQAMADDSYALSTALNAKKPVFIGWSMGGAVAEQIGFTYENNLTKVVLIAPLTMNNQPPPVDSDEIVKPLRTYNDVLNYVFDNNLYDYSPKQLKHYKNDLVAPNDQLFPQGAISANQNKAMNDWAVNPSTLAAAKSSDIKFLFMIPVEDKMLVPNKTEADAKLFKNATVVKFEGSGHNISMQAPDMACKQINDFL